METGVDRLFASAVKKCDNDAVVDGLMICGTCGAPKQRRISIDGTVHVIPDVCRCERKKREEEQKRKEEQKREQHVSAWRKECFSSFGDGSLRIADKMRFEGAPKSDTEKKCRLYAERFDIALENNYGIVLCGGVGTGKTHLAGCICSKVIEEGYTAAFRSLVPLAQKAVSVRESDREEAASILCATDLLVFDDFGVERRSEYMNEAVGTAIDIRYQTGKPLIITTNLTKNDFQNPQDESQRRVFSRITEMCAFLPVDGPDRRIAIHNAKYKGFSEAFGT